MKRISARIVMVAAAASALAVAANAIARAASRKPSPQTTHSRRGRALKPKDSPRPFYSFPAPEDFLKSKPDDAGTRLGFLYLYNMNYDQAIEEFRAELKSHPDDPFVVNHVLAAVLGKELHREGALNAALYMGNEFLSVKEPAADPAVKAEIEKLTEQSFALCDAELEKNPDDTDALYARGVARGLRAIYTGLIEKKWITALRSALGAYHDDEHILRVDPNYSDAKLVVGTYQYIVGSLSWWEKAMAYLVDVHGSKQRGFALLRQAADGGGEASVDARTVLALFLARERQYPQSIAILHRLYEAFPHNFLFALAEGDLLEASGQRQAAIEEFRRLTELAKEDEFPGARAERAAEELGRALRAEKDYASAARAFDGVATFPNANSSVLIRATLEAGEMYDLLNQREEAIKRYQRVISMDAPSAEAATARKLLKHPYRQK